MKKIFDRLPEITYLLIFSAMVCVIVFLCASSGNNSGTQDFAPDAVMSLDGTWTLKDGTPVDTQYLNELGGASQTEEYSIYTVIPENVPKGAALSFRVKHLFFSVFIDGNPVYSQTPPESRLYTNSVGASWVIVPLSSYDAGKTAELKFKVCYKNTACGIDSTGISAGNRMVIDLINKKIVTFIISLIYLTLAGVLIIFDLILGKKINQNHSFMCLGLITLAMAIFCVTETQLLQLFVSDKSIIHLITCFSLALGPLPVVMYTDAVFGFKSKKTVRVFALLNLITSITLFILNYTDIADLHDTLFIVHGFIAVSMAMMSYAIIRYVTANIKNHLDACLIMEITGFGILILSGAIDLFRYYFRNTNDPAKFLRIGLLTFIILFAAASCKKMLAIFETNAKTEIISKLAYEDGLTGLRNRTAYNEKLDELTKNEQPIGICAFDVNNLKTINDNMGHDMGDLLIRESARIISTSFEPCGGVCCRIGGDEFTVLVPGEDPIGEIKKALETLYGLCGKFNSRSDSKFSINIAAGYSLYDGSQPVDLVIKQADKLMYENKKEMKRKAAESPGTAG